MGQEFPPSDAGPCEKQPDGASTHSETAGVQVLRSTLHILKYKVERRPLNFGLT